MELNTVWIISTFILGATTLISVLINILMYYLMKPEGRYFFRQSLNNSTLDNIRHEPVSNNLILDSLRWNGQTFVNKTGIYYPLRAILNPLNKSQEIYNEIISKASRWAGSKRPVIFTTDLMSFAVTPEFYAAVEKAKHSEEYVKVRHLLADIAKLCEAEGVQYFSFIESFNIPEIQSVLRDVGPKKLVDSYKKGINAEKLKNTKIQGEGAFGKFPIWLIMLLLIGVVIVVGYFLLKSGFKLPGMG